MFSFKIVVGCLICTFQRSTKAIKLNIIVVILQETQIPIFVERFRIEFQDLANSLVSKMVTVMLVTTLCWWFYDGDRFKMSVTESLCWRLFPLCWWFFQCIKSVTNILNRSPTSQTYHQYILSPTSVTNIDVTPENPRCVYALYHIIYMIPIIRIDLVILR